VATPIPRNAARFTVDEVIAATSATVVRRGPFAAGAGVVTGVGVVTDSRAVREGNVFVAIKGESHDAHVFVSAAGRARASMILVERGRGAAFAADPALEHTTLLEVADTLVALGDLARAHLASWRSSGAAGGARKVVAVTGSAGKTTTKELIAALLGAVGPTHFTAGNLNNRVGVPLVVLGLEQSHRFAVLEMGMSLPGELDSITSFARPDVSVVTNVGIAHAEGVGGPEGVMREKGAVYRALDARGVAVVNADDERATRASHGTKAQAIVTFGVATNASYRLLSRQPRGESGSVVALATPGRELTLQLPLPGEVAAIDLCAALAAQESASGVLLPVETIDSELATVRLAGRATVMHLGEDIVVLDDTYNANPASMRSALTTLGEISRAGTSERRRVAVLGEMKELGAHAEAEHRALGDAVAAAGVALAIGCGGLISLALERAAELGVTVVSAASTADAAREATSRVRRSDAVLVKGSRSVAAEKVVAALSEAWPNAEKSAGSGSV
jgi:UDP-N-acetylmuramoyl-tripeptide--D-alanyl-D-alanine ligase